MVTMTRSRLTKIHFEGYIDFINALDYMLGEIHKQDVLRYHQEDTLWLWLHHIKPLPGIHQVKYKPGPWRALSEYAMIEPKYLLGTMRSTKFVQYNDFSLTNFLLQHIDPTKFKITATKIHLPSHVELKSFFVPEELILRERQDTIYNSDWI